MRGSVEAEVERLLARQLAPRLPRAPGELEFQLGRRLEIAEVRLRHRASVLGGVALKGAVDDLLVAGGSEDDLRDLLDQAASDLADVMSQSGGQAGTEAARLLADHARSRS